MNLRPPKVRLFAPRIYTYVHVLFEFGIVRGVKEREREGKQANYGLAFSQALCLSLCLSHTRTHTVIASVILEIYFLQPSKIAL